MTPIRLGRYEILKHLAQGGMAEVLLARSVGIEGFERHVVIKRIRTEQAQNSQFVKMFLDEARLAAALHHQNIVQVHDIGQEDGEYFFAMEYVHGEDVRTLLRQASMRKQLLPIEHAITIVVAAAAGIHHAHEQLGADRKPLGIVHRDISPANILIGFDGGVKVVDFGIAKAASRSTETASGTIKGKVAYMSPEQSTGRPVDRRADVFALGIVLYELVTVRRLFKADSDFLMMTAIVQGHIPLPTQYRPDVPPELVEIIMKALSVRPDDRYPTADAMRLALEQFATKAGLQTSTSLLADYIKEQFGQRAEPWLVDDAPLESADVDFDGSASSIVAPFDGLIENFALPSSVRASPSSPILKARTKAITSRLATGTNTPLAWSEADAVAVAPAPRRRRALIVGGLVVVAIAVAIVVVMSSGGDRDSTPAVANRPAAVAPAVAATPDAGVAELAASPDGGVETTIPTIPPQADTQPVATTSKPPVKPVRPVVKPGGKPIKPVKPNIKPAEDLDSPFPH